MMRETACTSWFFSYFYRGYPTGALGARARM
jgi:hypothetical protein